MSEEDPKPGVIIDVEPEDATPAPDEHAIDADNEPQAHTPTETGQEKSGSNILPLVIAIIALLSVAGAGWYGYEYTKQLREELAAMNVRVEQAREQQTQLNNALGNATETLRAQEGVLGEQQQVLSKQQDAVQQARDAFKQQEQKLADENVRLQEREAELRAAVADVHRRVGRSGTQWMIAEAEYLLRIASHRLSLARDTKTARLALELADQRLRDTNDPGWTGVREQIARDIAKLSAFEAPDEAGMSARLSALIEQIPQLQLARATIGPERTLPERPDRDPSERSWDTLLDDLWGGLKDSVRIHERDQPVQAMLAPEHQFFLYENLKLQMEAARLGLARNDQALFHDNLATAGEWLNKYFNPEDGTTKAIGEAIAQMRDVQIRPELPDISQSLRTLQVRKKLMEDVAPSGVAEQ